MALRIPQGTQMLKDGYKHLQGVDEAVLRNITAVHDLSEITRTSFGPNGRNKIIINHNEKLFVTNDAATIIRELEVVHPAAKLLVMASQQQEAEMGDASNLVSIIAGELLQKAEHLLRMGLHPSDIVQGYEVASAKALEILEELSVEQIKSVQTKEDLFKAVRSSIAAKQYGNEDMLTDLVCEAAIAVMPKDASNFNVDNVRVVKIMGSSLYESRVIKGMVFGRSPEGVITNAKKAKVAIFTCPLDVAQTETKGTVLIHNANEMLDFTKGEEKHMEQMLKGIADAGVKVVVTGNNVGELALHYLNRFGIMVVKVLSKFDLRRLCRVTGATALARVGAPMAEEMGFCDIVESVEIGGDRVTVFRQEEEISKTATIVVRGATLNHLDDVERALDDGINVIKALVKDPRLVPGAGACEMELLKRLLAVGEKTPGLNQHSIKKFAEAFEVIPRTLAENAGMDATEVLSKLYASHHADDSGVMGVDIESENNGLLDAHNAGIFDVLSAKSHAIRLATETAMTVLRVDQLIMSKAAGGPVAPKQKQHWDED
ncbi:T-complex protein 1 theta subunit [Linnemannia elongata]|nr:T-complex protein 1 subunit theta [Linnemannia elongata]KAF9334141.1 T-complex protein 1 subunit theta [Linnemannia elongata]KAG0068631.1 T-complex protein 1 subunit theta [Linnemannia elongata]KAG0075557.1 T-complex protein 1 subunit theta [Linnemannia elongata]KAH7043054.1 T-complex protein 1 theta subunit [Linnemannia elongata]